MLQSRQAATGLMSHSASPLDHLVSFEMDRLASISTTTTAASTTFDRSSNNTTSPISLTSRPILAPKHTSPSSSLSGSPPITFIDSATTTTTKKPTATKKRTRAESTAAGSSNGEEHSAQDSEEERIIEKRRRNTMAARRFRKRKLDHVSDLESKLATVTQERDELRLQIAKWEGEVMALRKLLERKE